MTTLSDTTNNLFQIYSQSIIDLAQSMVIKFDQVAQATNQLVLANTGVLTDPNDRTTWKYYQNISGQYNFSDTPMTVYSLDSETTINFDIPTLANNPVTKAAYAFGSSYYNELLAKYPTQEMLILGILYPCNMTDAINSKDGTIVSYPGFLVEAAETSLIEKLQKWLYAHINRWVVMPFTLSDDLYSVSYLAQIVQLLVPAIFNLRLAACRTNQAHSYHIRQYLRSHGFIDTYLNEMTAQQAFNMYRNITYYQNNAGFESTFNDLVDVLFTQVGMPIYSYEMHHNVEAMSHTTFTDTPNIFPTSLFKRVPVNSIAVNYPETDYNLTQVMSLMDTATPNNETYQANNATKIAQQLALSVDAELLTKVVEVAINPVAEPAQQVPDAILFNQWVSLVSQGRYDVPVEYTPVGSSNPIRMTHQQALAMWAYATAMALAPQNPNVSYTPLTRVPQFVAQRVVIEPPPTLSVLQAMVDSTVVDTSALTEILASAATLPTQITSLTQFQSVCKNIYSANLLQYQLYSYQQNPYARAYCQAASDRLYQDAVYALSDLADTTTPTEGMLYSTLISQLGLNLSSYRPVDFYNMATAIYDSATGAVSTSLLDPGNIQAAMMNLMAYLSSYSVQFVSTGLSDLVTTVPHPDVRTFDVNMVENSDVYVDEVFDVVSEVRYQESINKIFVLPDVASESSSVLCEQEQDQVNTLLNDTSYYQGGSVCVHVYSGLDAWTGQDQTALFNALTLSQKQAVVSATISLPR